MHKLSDAGHFVKWFKLLHMDFVIHAYSSILVRLLIENDIFPIINSVQYKNC